MGRPPPSLSSSPSPLLISLPLPSSFPRDLQLRDGVIRRNADYTDGLVRPPFYGRPGRRGGRGAAGRLLQMGHPLFGGGRAGMAGPSCAGHRRYLSSGLLSVLYGYWRCSTCWPARRPRPAACTRCGRREEKPNENDQKTANSIALSMPSRFLCELIGFLFSRRRHHAERI